MRYTVKGASLATGVSESRLRTWERRYGIPSPQRSSTGRRLYGEDDLALIRRMAALVTAGVSPSEAAQAAKAGGSAEAHLAEIDHLPAEHPLVAAIGRASADYDEASTLDAVREAVSSLGWARALEEVLMPALRGIGRLWSENAIISSNEHFTSEIIRREIAVGCASLDLEANGDGILLACAEDERHEIGLLALSLLLRGKQMRTVYLGADVPTSDLVAAAHRTQPRALCLSATTRSGRASLGRCARALIGARVTARLFVGGPAFRGALEDDSIPGVVLPQSLGAATDAIVGSITEERS